MILTVLYKSGISETYEITDDPIPYLQLSTKDGQVFIPLSTVKSYTLAATQPNLFAEALAKRR